MLIVRINIAFSQTPLGIECTLCEFVMKELFSLLNGNTTEVCITYSMIVCMILYSCRSGWESCSLLVLLR